MKKSVQILNLHGLLPEQVETIEEQVERAYRQLIDFKSDIDKHIYLRNIQDTNETLFYRLIDAHLTEVMPIIYTPTVVKLVSISLTLSIVHVVYLFIQIVNTSTTYKTPPNKM